MPKILIKRGTATQWTNSTTPLLSGELGLDTSNNILKVGNGTTLWNSLAGLTLSAAQVDELAQDAVAAAFNHEDHTNIVITYSDSNNKITLSTGPDVVTTTSLNNTLTDSSTGYVPISDVGNVDGVAPLDENSLIPDEYIPSTIARDSEIPSLTGYATETYVSTAISNLVDSAPTTLNTLNELAAALGDDPNYATTISTALGNKLDSTTAASTYLTQTNAASTYATQTSLADKADKLITRNPQTSSYPLDPSDLGKLIEMSGGGNLTITDSMSFPVGFTVDVLQTTDSQVTIQGNGFTVNATPGLKLRTRWSSATLIKRALNTWVAIGDLSA